MGGGRREAEKAEGRDARAGSNRGPRPAGSGTRQAKQGEAESSGNIQDRCGQAPLVPLPSASGSDQQSSGALTPFGRPAPGETMSNRGPHKQARHLCHIPGTHGKDNMHHNCKKYSFNAPHRLYMPNKVLEMWWPKQTLSKCLQKNNQQSPPPTPTSQAERAPAGNPKAEEPPRGEPGGRRWQGTGLFRRGLLLRKGPFSSPTAGGKHTALPCWTPALKGFVPSSASC